MGAKLYWTTDSTTCANCGAQLSRTGRQLPVKRGSEPVPIWKCESCDMDFVQYQDNSAVIQFEKTVSCKYLPDSLGSTVKAIKDAEDNQSISGLKNLSDAAKAIVEADKLAEEQARIEAQKALEAAKEKVLRAFVEPYKYLYETYNLDAETLTTIFDFQPWASEYLASIYAVGHKPLELAVDDDRIPIEKRNKISAYFKEKYREQISARAQEIKGFFKQNYMDGDSPLLLDDEQAFAVALDKKRVLVSARAGSGKTRVIASKILYLLDHEQVPEDAIISLSFNVNVMNEVNNRINKKIRHIGSPNRNFNIARTFHSLAYYCEDENKILSKEKNRYIQFILEEMKSNNPQFREKVYQFFRDESFSVDRTKVTDLEEYYDKLRNHTYITLQNEYVRSLGEKWIADYFFEHGIDYRYEHSFSYYGIDEYTLNCPKEKKDEIIYFLENRFDSEAKKVFRKKRSMKPDFYLPRYEYVLEHWGIDEKETDPDKKRDFSVKFETSWDDYYDIMQWKRTFWSYPWKDIYRPEKKQHFLSIKGLLETSIVDMQNGREEFEHKLEELLFANGIKPVPQNKEVLIEKMWKEQVTSFTKMVTSFIDRYQQHFPLMGLKNFEDYISKQNLEGVNKVFTEICLDVLKEYERTLNMKKKPAYLKAFNQYHMDFNTLMVNATRAVRSGACDDMVMPLRYLLVDEYQDFSELFYRFITAILERNPEIQLFCVGDPWQAINRFMGADTYYFNNFDACFKDTYETEVTTNYRSSANIIVDSNRFMWTNDFPGTPAQYSKGIYADKELIDISSEFIEKRFGNPNYEQDQHYAHLVSGPYKNQSDRLTAYLKSILGRIKYRESDCESWLILSRTNHFGANMTLEMLEKVLKDDLRAYGCSEEYINKIHVKTIHSSKGDEADNVIILRANEGNMPLIHPDTELYSIFGETISTAYEDEARLFYVAITRPKKRLFILYDYVDKLGKVRPSPFIAQMGSDNSSFPNSYAYQDKNLIPNDEIDDAEDYTSHVDLSGLLNF